VTASPVAAEQPGATEAMVCEPSTLGSLCKASINLTGQQIVTITAIQLTCFSEKKISF
jgi:hypothetical protein